LKWEITYYSNPKVFIALVFAHINQDKLGVSVVKCAFVSYLEGVKGYKLWKVWHEGESRIIISNDVTFDETHMRIKWKDLNIINSYMGWRKFSLRRSFTLVRQDKMKRIRLWPQVQVEDNQLRLIIISWLKIGRYWPLLHQQDTIMLIWFVFL